MSSLVSICSYVVYLQIVELLDSGSSPTLSHCRFVGLMLCLKSEIEVKKTVFLFLFL